SYASSATNLYYVSLNASSSAKLDLQFPVTTGGPYGLYISFAACGTGSSYADLYVNGTKVADNLEFPNSGCAWRRMQFPGTIFMNGSGTNTITLQNAGGG